MNPWKPHLLIQFNNILLNLKIKKFLRKKMSDESENEYENPEYNYDSDTTINVNTNSNTILKTISDPIPIPRSNNSPHTPFHTPHRTPSLNSPSLLKPVSMSPLILDGSSAFPEIISSVELKEMKQYVNDHPHLLAIHQSEDELWHALTVINHIQPNEKLCTHNGIFIQKKTDKFQGFFRWFWNDSRETSVKDIKFIFMCILQRIENALKNQELINQKLETYHNQKPLLLKKRANEKYLEKSLELLKQSKKALENLKKTYSIDTSISARIQLLEQFLNDHLELIEFSQSLLK